jgi:hypothetical protein
MKARRPLNAVGAGGRRQIGELLPFMFTALVQQGV